MVDGKLLRNIRQPYRTNRHNSNANAANRLVKNLSMLNQIEGGKWEGGESAKMESTRKGKIVEMDRTQKQQKR